MRLKELTLAIVLVFGFLSLVPIQKSAHAESVVSIDLFYQELSPHGGWSPHPEFGYVWQPYEVGPHWKPYTDGRWEWSDQGWLWISYEPWGWATYHYGRWVYDDYAGWIWIPGTTWAPAWVSWQESPEYIGWSPLPPDRGFFIEIGLVFNSYKSYYKPYGYKHRHKKHRYYHDYYHNPHYYKPPAKHCVFVPYHKFGKHKHVARHAIPHEYATTLRNSKNVTNIKRVNNKVYNYGPNKYAIEKRSNRKLKRHRIHDNYATELRSKKNLHHIKGKAYNASKPKINRASKDPFTTNRSNHYKGNSYQKEHRRYDKYKQPSNHKSFNTQTRRLKSSNTAGSHQKPSKKGFNHQSGKHEQYGYTTRSQNTYQKNQAKQYKHNGRDHRTYDKNPHTLHKSKQDYHKSKKLSRDKFKTKTKTKSRNYSNNQKPYSIKNRSTQQRSYKPRSGNVPTSQKNKFSRYR